MKRFIYVILFVCFFSSCSLIGSKKETKIGKRKVKGIVNIDSVTCATNTINFFNWYKETYDSIWKYSWIISIENDSSIVFSLDTSKSNRYLRILQKSGFVSQNYIDNWRRKIKKSESELGNSDIPDGFDYDYILLTQETEEALANIDSLKIINYRKKKGKVEINTSLHLKIIFIKQKNVWLIDSIINNGFNING